MNGNKIYCLVGPSGVGKDTIKRALKLPYIVSYRTRPTREGEVDGTDGYFITIEQFERMRNEGRWIVEVNYTDNYYGISQDELLPLEESPLIYVIDLPSVNSLKRKLDQLEGYSSDQLVTIYLKSDKKDIENRMIRQGRKALEIGRRMIQHDFDLESEHGCDYVVYNKNGKIAETLNEIYRIIIKEQASL